MEDGGLAGWLQRVEAPTWGLVVAIYGGWLGLTWWWHALPVWVVWPVGAWLCAWQMSLQHEVIHGHPTRWRVVNDALGWPPLSLWLPFAAYRDSHLLHHRDAYLTDPLEDPESTYVVAGAWVGLLVLVRVCNTLVGRLVLGPLVSAVRFWVSEIGAGRFWWGHFVGVGVVLWWVCDVCGIGFWAYVGCCVYPGTALILLRSLAEHRAAARVEDRTAVVERAGLLGVLYLYNNLHVLHHARPDLAWFQLPGVWRAVRGEVLGARRGPVYAGYGEVVRRFAVRAHHGGVWPGVG